MIITWGLFMGFCALLLFISPILDRGQRSAAAQGIQISPLLSDGQFVWGPNVGEFDIGQFLKQRNSPLFEYADDIEVWAAYTSINPKVLLTVLQLRHQWLDHIPEGVQEDVVLAEIEAIAMDLANAFYTHMYSWGSRSNASSAKSFELPTFTFGETDFIQINPDSSSASFAIASILVDAQDQESWESLITPKSVNGFTEVFALIFPETDLLDESNNLDPPGLPPDDFLQLPFPLGAEWTFNGTHSWHGGDIGPDRSSMDFSTNWPRGSSLPDHYTAASHAGVGYVYAPSRTNLPCWVAINYEMNPGEVWSTSYYHLLNLGDPGDRGWIARNQSVGKIGMEVCNGGFASSAHVHFTLRYNGAFFDLDGVKLSGWIVHSGPDPYYSGYIERDGEILYPYDRLVNDYQDYFGNGLDFALQLVNDPSEISGHVRIQIDDPEQNTPGPPADVGFHDFVIEWWLKADPGSNTAPDVECGANDNWKDGNIIFDRSRSTDGAEWGISLVGGRLAFGVRGDDLSEITLCSANRVDDGAWHHIAVQRNRWEGSIPDGQLWIFVDGQLEAEAIGPQRDISYPDDGNPGPACSPSVTGECIFSDPFLFIGSSKSDRGHGFSGLIDNVRFSWWLRYLTGFDPTPNFNLQDSQTVALLQFNEGRGDTMFDTGGYDGGASNAHVILGSSSASPKWAYSDLTIQTLYFFPWILD